MDSTSLKEVFDELISTYQNLKAEVLIAEVQEHVDLEASQIIVNHKGTFQRPYRRDLLTIEKSKLEDDLLSIDLSRNSLYDYLPEGLFHSQNSSNKSLSFSAQRINSKKEEANARSLFSPIENEFFHQRLNIEVNERALLNNFYSIKHDYLIDFWKLTQEMPREYLLKLIKLLPYSFKIAGDLELTRFCLEKILLNDVSFIKKYKAGQVDKKENQKQVSRLGVDLVLDHSENTTFYPYLEVTIWLKDRKQIDSYVSKQGINAFLDVFYSYFLPLELDVETKYDSKTNLGFSLDSDNPATIGISTKL